MLRPSVFLPAVDVFQHPIDKTSLNDGQLRGKTKQRDVSCKTSPPHSLQAATPVQTIVRRARESLRCWQIDVSVSSLKARANGGDWSGVIDVSSAHVRKCRISAATVRKHGDTELHEQPLFPHRDTTKLGVRASLSTWKRYESTDNSRKSVFPQLWI